MLSLAHTEENIQIKLYQFHRTKIIRKVMNIIHLLM